MGGGEGQMAESGRDPVTGTMVGTVEYPELAANEAGLEQPSMTEALLVSFRPVTATQLLLASAEKVDVSMASWLCKFVTLQISE